MSRAARPATTADESPIFFEAGGESVFGLLTRPTAGPRGVAVMSAPGGWFGTSAGRNRLLIRLSRLLAADGYHAFRFDYHGVGESTGAIDGFRLDQLFTEDLEGAIRVVRDHGVDRILLVGVCMGARVAISVARDLPSLEGLVLVSPPIHEGERPARRSTQPGGGFRVVRGARLWMVGDLLRRERRAVYTKFLRKRWRMLRERLLGRRRTPRGGGDRLSWVSPSLLDGLEKLVDRRVPMLIVYGTQDAHYRDFIAARSGRLGELLRRAGSVIEVETIDGPVHGFGEIRVQDAVIGSVRRWVTRSGDTSPARPRSRAAATDGGPT